MTSLRAPIRSVCIILLIRPTSESFPGTVRRIRKCRCEFFLGRIGRDLIPRPSQADRKLTCAGLFGESELIYNLIHAQVHFFTLLQRQFVENRRQGIMQARTVYSQGYFRSYLEIDLLLNVIPFDPSIFKEAFEPPGGNIHTSLSLDLLFSQTGSLG